MIMNKPEDIKSSSFKTKEYLPGNTSYLSSDSLNMISQLANELYREDAKEASMNNRIVMKKTDFSVDSGNNGDSAYYFLPGYQSAPYTKQMSTPYYKPALDVYSIRKDFPILQRRINGKPLVWLDNAATTQKPICVINALNRYYSEYNSNIHRGAHTLAKLATNAYETAREKVRNFIGAPSTEEIIFVRGTTEAINLVAESFGGMNIQTGDEIVLTMMEHHSNIVPWQKLKQEKGAVIKVIPINDRGEIILDEYEKLLTPRTRIVSIAHVSNVLGTVNPVRKMIEIAHKHGAFTLIDGAQSVPHIGVDVRELDADFYAFSGHKIYGPTGIGVLYGKRVLLEVMSPWQRGGGMIEKVNFKETTYNSLPYKFEAGTGNIADAVGLGTAIDYIQEIGMDNIERHEKELTVYAMEKLYQIPGLHIIGTAPEKTSVISFVIDGMSPENIAQYLNLDGIAVRSGHHCAQPTLHRYGLNSSIRASLGVYNTMEEIDCMVNAVLKIAKYYKKN
jgi:cysteine desulfurase/selenocysteine lyase